MRARFAFGDYNNRRRLRVNGVPFTSAKPFELWVPARARRASLTTFFFFFGFPSFPIFFLRTWRIGSTLGFFESLAGWTGFGADKMSKRKIMVRRMMYTRATTSTPQSETRFSSGCTISYTNTTRARARYGRLVRYGYVLCAPVAYETGPDRGV